MKNTPVFVPNWRTFSGARGQKGHNFVLYMFNKKASFGKKVLIQLHKKIKKV